MMREAAAKQSMRLLTGLESDSDLMRLLILVQSKKQKLTGD